MLTDLFGILMFLKNVGSWASFVAVSWYAKQCQYGRNTRITCSMVSTVLPDNYTYHSQCTAYNIYLIKEICIHYVANEPASHN